MEVPVPTVAEAGQGAAYLTDKAGITATVLAIGALILIAAFIWERIKCSKDSEKAWARVTALSEARTADALATLTALANVTNALGKVSTLLESVDRRGR